MLAVPDAPPLIGDHRRRLVVELISAYERASQGAVEFIGLRGRSGLGKTRLVQELYAALASRQAEPAFWPTRLVGPGAGASRKVIAPLLVGQQVDPAAVPDYVWTGFSCRRAASGTLGEHAPMHMLSPAFTQQVEGLRPWIERAERAELPWVRRLGRVLAGNQASWAAADLVWIISSNLLTMGVAGSVKDLIDAWRDSRELIAARAGSDSEERIPDPLFDLALRMAATIVELSRHVPWVVVIDDLHDADEYMTAFALSLLAGAQLEGSRVLILTTYWPAPLESGSAGDLARHMHDVIDLDAHPLGQADREQLMRNKAPGTADDIVTGIARKYTTPLSLLSWLLIEPIRQQIAATSAVSPELFREFDAAVGDDVREVLEAQFRYLPADVRRALHLLAHMGLERWPQVGAEIALTAGDGSREQARAALDAAREPHGWTRTYVTGADQFVELVHHTIAAGNRVTTEREMREARAAISAWFVSNWPTLVEPSG
jgi:hypothetical protein